MTDNLWTLTDETETTAPMDYKAARELEAAWMEAGRECRILYVPNIGIPAEEIAAIALSNWQNYSGWA